MVVLSLRHLHELRKIRSVRARGRAEHLEFVHRMYGDLDEDEAISRADKGKWVDKSANSALQSIKTEDKYEGRFGMFLLQNHLSKRVESF